MSIIRPMQLDQYSTGEFKRGASKLKEGLWLLLGSPLVRSNIVPCSRIKVWVLRAFGATIGKSVRIKPGVKIKFPWKLEIGNYSWIGEDVWIDNLAFVRIGSNCCISQGAYLCTGSHDWSKSNFELQVSTIEIHNNVWIAAFAKIAPGVIAHQGSVLSFAAVATRSLDAWCIYSGNPASKIKSRTMESR